MDSIDYMKMAIVQELNDALRVKRINDEMLEYFTSTLSWIIRYCDRNKMPVPDKDKIIELMKKGIELEKRMPTKYISDESLQAHKNTYSRRRLDEAKHRKIY